MEIFKKMFTLLDLCVSSLRRGHAKLLCIVPILTDDPRRESERKVDSLLEGNKRHANKVSQEPEGEKKLMRMPGVEPGSQAWEACMMPLHYMRLSFVPSFHIGQSLRSPGTKTVPDSWRTVVR